MDRETRQFFVALVLCDRPIHSAALNSHRTSEFSLELGAFRTRWWRKLCANSTLHRKGLSQNYGRFHVNKDRARMASIAIAVSAPPVGKWTARPDAFGRKSGNANAFRRRRLGGICGSRVDALFCSGRDNRCGPHQFAVCRSGVTADSRLAGYCGAGVSNLGRPGPRAGACGRRFG